MRTREWVYQTFETIPLDPYDADGHSDLPQYRPYMGPRYAPRGRKIPLSVFRGEAMMLWTLAKVLKPLVALDLFSGTGLSATMLQHANPSGRVITVDHFGEGEQGEDGIQSATSVFDHFGAHPDLRMETFGDGLACLHGVNMADVEFIMFDGMNCHPDLIAACPMLKVFGVHDMGPAGNWPYVIPIPGGSLLHFVAMDPIHYGVVRGITDETAEWLASR